MTWILLLFSLTSSVCGLFLVQKSPTFYQAEEQEKVTFGWDSKNKTDLSFCSLTCFLQAEPLQMLYEMTDGVEDPESQHQQFAGRVHLDRDALREGQIRLHLSTVTAEDSGSYCCDLAADYGENMRTWELLATEYFVLNVSQNNDGQSRDVSVKPGLSAEGAKGSFGPRDVSEVIQYIVAPTFLLAEILVFIICVIWCSSPARLRRDEDQQHNTDLLGEPEDVSPKEPKCRVVGFMKKLMNKLTGRKTSEQQPMLAQV